MPEMKVLGNTPQSDLAERLEDDRVGEMRILSRRGDTKVTWDARDKHEVKAAKKQFESLTGKGFVAYEVSGEGGQGEQIREFNPAAEKIILAPALAGGC